VLGVRLTGSHRVPPLRGASRLRSGSYVSARSEIMARIDAALGPGGAVPEVPRDYHQAGSGAAAGDEAVVARFCERAAEYRATVRRVAPGGLEDAVVEACREHGARRIAVPPGAPHHLPGLELLIDDPPISARGLDQVDGVLTGCALAIAETGTIVLDGGDRSGRRALSLVPDFHVCLVEAGRIHASVPDAIAALAPAAAEGRPLTFVSGPSATSDIELERVEGVHGPRTLVILVLEG
jgi:L-lactate dehydrogenase complex protein LldG